MSNEQLKDLYLKKNVYCSTPFLSGPNYTAFPYIHSIHMPDKAKKAKQEAGSAKQEKQEV